MLKTMPEVQNQREKGASIYAGFLLILVIAAPLLFIACPRGDSRPDNRNIGVSMGTPNQTPAPIAEAIAINGERAMDHVRKQLDLGPRPPGSPELAKTRDYIINELRNYGLVVSTNEFSASTPVGERRMTNIIGEIPGESKDIILIASHYDTKLYKDMRFVGANDPGASVGTLLEMGRVLGAVKGRLKMTYRLVFFDGEEAFCEDWDQC